MKYYTLLLLLLFIFSCQKKDIFKEKRELISDQNFKTKIEQDIRGILNKNTEGRYPGTFSYDSAAEYIAFQFKRMGLQKAPFLDSYYQFFSLFSGILIEKPKVFFGRRKLILGKDYVIALTSGKGSLYRRKAVFVGYGVSNGTLGYNDYKMVDASNKIVIMFKNLPHRFIKENPKYANLYYRTYIAKNHGAKGVIFLDIKNTNIAEISNDAYIPSSHNIFNIPQIIISYNGLLKLFKTENKDFIAIKNDIDSSNTPNSFYLKTRITLSINMSYKNRRTMNIIGYLPASHKYLHAKKSIFITANLDSLGKQNNIYYEGANYNASAVITLLNIARNIVNTKGYFRKNDIYFVVFSGKEEGLKGATALLSTEEINKRNSLYMIKLENIGASVKLLEIGGGVDYPSLYQKVDNANKIFNLNFDLSVSIGGYAEDLEFIENNIPALFIYSPNLKYKNTLLDTKEKININSVKKTAKLVYLTIFDDIFEKIKEKKVKQNSK